MIAVNGSLSGSLTAQGSLSGSLTVERIETPPYTGAYEVTPTQQAQTLSTDGLRMTGDVVIHPIPSNYGRIAWNGAVLTVS